MLSWRSLKSTAVATLATVLLGTAAGGSAFDGTGSTGTASGEDCAVREYAMGLRYQQQSAEVRAQQIQSFRVAEHNLDAMVSATPRRERDRLAIMTDLDETVVDNSELFVRDMMACHDYTTWDTWTDWELHGDPKLNAGAKRFFDHANKLGVHVYYVSDRSDETKKSTLATLEKLKLPQVSEKSVLLAGPSKAERRRIITQQHRLIMQLGDSLADFDSQFKSAPLDVQKSLVEKNSSHFGWDWIMLPNASYGTWHDANTVAWNRHN